MDWSFGVAWPADFIRASGCMSGSNPFLGWTIKFLSRCRNGSVDCEFWQGHRTAVSHDKRGVRAIRPFLRCQMAPLSVRQLPTRKSLAWENLEEIEG